jgi:hypothetical protein
MLRFNKMSFYFADTIEREDKGVKGGPKTRWRREDKGYFMDNCIVLTIIIEYSSTFKGLCPLETRWDDSS